MGPNRRSNSSWGLVRSNTHHNTTDCHPLCHTSTTRRLHRNARDIQASEPYDSAGERPWWKSKLLWVARLGVILSGGLLLLTVGDLGLAVYSGLVSGTPIVEVLLDIAVPTIAGIAPLLVILVVSGLGLVWVLAQNASLPRSDRVTSLAERLEREHSLLRVLGRSDLLTPPEPSAEEQAEQALATLKQQYVNGEISEAEFERRVDRLVVNDSTDDGRPARERRQVVERDPDSR